MNTNKHTETENGTAVGGRLKRLAMREFSNGLTVRELKELINDWAETNQYGEDCEIWIETGENLSSPVTVAGPLNMCEDEDGNVSADLILGSNAFSA